jgi:hypothetical protein
MINPWTQGRVPGVRTNPALGAWQNRRKLASAAWVPPQWARLSLDGAHIYWYTFPGPNGLPGIQLAAAETQLSRVTVQEDFWLIAVLGTGTSNLGVGVAGSPGSFRLQIYEEQGSYKQSKYGLDQHLGSGFGIEPGLQKMPHFIPRGSPVNVRVQNLDGANPNTVTLAMWGYSAWWRS